MRLPVSSYPLTFKDVERTVTFTSSNSPEVFRSFWKWALQKFHERAAELETGRGREFRGAGPNRSSFASKVHLPLVRESPANLGNSAQCPL